MFLDSYEVEEEFGAYHNVTVERFEDGSALVRTDTNDNLDQGYPNECASWEHLWPSVELALKHVGFSRVGASGVRVRVYVDGVERTAECAACNQNSLGF